MRARRYKDWVKKHLAGNKNVFRVAVAYEVSQKLTYAATQIPNVQLTEYGLSVTLRPVALDG